MAEGDSEPQVCRFCLDSGQSSKNPLINPCECKGSIELIHLICLNKWRTLNPERNRQSCSLCFSDYRIPLVYDVEAMPGGSISYYLLDSSLLLNLFIHYVGVVLYVSSTNFVTLKQVFYGIQLFYHGIQFFLMYKFFNVRKQADYFGRWIQEKRFLLVPFHAGILCLGIHQNPVLAFIASSLCTNLYWMNHLEILHLMNRELENQTE